MASSSPHAPIASGCEPDAGAPGEGLSALERRLLDEFQRGFPLETAPFAAIANRVGSTEAEVLAAFARLAQDGFMSRIGPVFAPHAVGASLLAAMAVPASRVDEVAALVSALAEVNHNYEREHTYNLWFVVTGEDDAHVARTVDGIERRTGIEVLRLPLERPYHIDLGFRLWD